MIQAVEYGLLPCEFEEMEMYEYGNYLTGVINKRKNELRIQIVFNPLVSQEDKQNILNELDSDEKEKSGKTMIEKAIKEREELDKVFDSPEIGKTDLDKEVRKFNK